MKVSVIIATMNRADDLQKALQSVLEQTIPPCDIIVVDQSESDKSKAVCENLAARFKEQKIDLKYLSQAEKSLVKARNRGLANASGDILSFLDDDAVLLADYFEHAIAFFEKNPDVGALSGNALVPDEPAGIKWFLRKSLMRLFLISNFDGRMTSSGFGFPIFDCRVDKLIFVEMLPGCNMNFRREVLGDDVFDEWFTGYSYREDADFSYRISKKCRVAMIPEARLHHFYSPSGRLDEKNLKKMEFRNYYHVFKKYKYQNNFSQLLFYYTLFGLVFINGVECLVTWKKKDLNKFWAGLTQAFQVEKR